MHKFDLGQTVEHAFYRSSAPRTLPVARLTKCTCAHARQLTFEGIHIRRRDFVGRPVLHVEPSVWAAIKKSGHGWQIHVT